MDKNVKTALIIGGVIVAVLIVLSLVFGLISGGQYGGWGMMGPGMMGGFGWVFGPIFMVLFWGLIIWGIVALVRGVSRPSGSDSAPPTADSALEILKRRYARGELNKEEYEEKKKDLT
jgi:putative membrane protein